MRRVLYSEDHLAFRETVREFLAKNVVPNFPEWEREGKVPRSIFRAAGEIGMVGIQVPVEYGGAGVSSFLFNALIIEELARAYVTLGGLGLHMNVVLPYFLSYGTEEQKRRWLPGMATGALMSAIAMTEPGTGSDLAGIKTSAVRQGDEYVLNGSKTFITGGANADLVVVVARTSNGGERRSGLTLVVVEGDRPGFRRGQTLDKLGLKAQDTTELFFEDVRVPVENRLGEEGLAFSYLGANLAQERLAIAIGAQAACVTAIETTIAYVTERRVFGRLVSDFQNTKFVLAECSAEADAGQMLVDRAIQDLDENRLTPVDAAKAKLFCSEMQGRILDRCLQLFGGYGFMLEYPIAKMYADARVTRIYGGTSEVMKSVISKSMGL